MRPTSPLQTGALLLGALLAAVLEVGTQLAARGTAAAPPPGAWLASLLVLAVIAAVGRTALALLPPGALGSHRPSELAATWAASHLLGAALLAAERAWALRAGLEPSAALLIGPWALLAAARLALLPAALRPRHDLDRGPPSFSAAVARAALLAALALPLVRIALGRGAAERAGLGAGSAVAALGSELAALAGASAAGELVAAASWAAAAALVAHALAESRRAPRVRVLAALLTALAPFGVVSASLPRGAAHAALFFGAGAALLVPWIQRADRRALGVAVIALAATALEGPPGVALALCGALAAVLATPRPSRGRAALAAALALAAASLPALGAGGAAPEVGASPIGLPETAWRLFSAALLPRDWGAGWLCVLAALAVTGARWLALRRGPAPVRLGIGEPTVLWLACAAGAAAIVLARPSDGALAPALLALWPAAVTAAALVFSTPAPQPPGA